MSPSMPHCQQQHQAATERTGWEKCLTSHFTTLSWQLEFFSYIVMQPSMVLCLCSSPWNSGYPSTSLNKKTPPSVPHHQQQQLAANASTGREKSFLPVTTILCQLILIFNYIVMQMSMQLWLSLSPAWITRHCLQCYVTNTANNNNTN